MDLWHQLRGRPVELGALLLRQRFIKFGSVGFLGTLVNLGMLALGQELLFASVHDPARRLDLSLSLAICLATIHNFTWNRLWTWGDRRGSLDKGFVPQFGQYALASGLAILLQFLLTKGLVVYIHYIPANVTAIALAAVLNYLLNDAWTFSLRQFYDKLGSHDQPRPPGPV